MGVNPASRRFLSPFIAKPENTEPGFFGKIKDYFVNLKRPTTQAELDDIGISKPNDTLLGPVVGKLGDKVGIKFGAIAKKSVVVIVVVAFLILIFYFLAGRVATKVLP